MLCSHCGMNKGNIVHILSQCWLSFFAPPFFVESAVVMEADLYSLTKVWKTSFFPSLHPVLSTNHNLTSKLLLQNHPSFHTACINVHVQPTGNAIHVIQNSCYAECEYSVCFIITQTLPHVQSKSKKLSGRLMLDKHSIVWSETIITKQNFIYQTYMTQNRGLNKQDKT